MSPARLPLTPTGQGVLRIVGASIIDGTGAEPRTGVDVDVVDGTIARIGPTSPAASRADITL
ncbi:MAG: hypothetical protein ACK5IM_01560, partial [Demequina sp.]|uniref:hypothetical protein n=1 Tax=Demequina sp. TaxID=2050685 RepID=UPI003A85554E